MYFAIVCWYPMKSISCMEWCIVILSPFNWKMESPFISSGRISHEISHPKGHFHMTIYPWLKWISTNHPQLGFLYFSHWYQWFSHQLVVNKLQIGLVWGNIWTGTPFIGRKIENHGFPVNILPTFSQMKWGWIEPTVIRNDPSDRDEKWIHATAFQVIS